MLQEAQKDSIKVQILQTCNTLRTRATLLPEQSQIFRLGKGDETQENLSYEANQQLRGPRKYDAQEIAEMSISSIIQGQGLCSSQQTIFYIPSSEEIITFDRAQGTSSSIKEHTSNFVAPDSIDSIVKNLAKRPTLLSQPVYKLEGKQQYGVRKTWLEEAPNLMQHDALNILIYTTQLLNIFDLEYTMLRNLAKSWQSQSLEDKALSGRPFWSEIANK